MAKVLVISMTKPLEDAVYHADIEELDDFYKHLECRCMDVARRKVGSKYFDIWVDDEGLLVDNPIMSAIRVSPDDNTFEPMLAGNLILANHDMEGNTTSLSRADTEMIINSIVVVVGKDERQRPCLICDY